MEFLIAIAVILALVWGAFLALRGSLISGAVLYLACVCCFGSYFMSIDSGSVHLTLDRFYLLGLAAAYVLQRHLGRTDPKPLSLADGLLFAFLGLLAVSMFTHDWKNAYPITAPPLQHLINGYLIPFSLYWVARQAKFDEKTVGKAPILLAIFGLYLAIIGFLEVAQAWSLVFPKYIADPTVGLHFGRARGPMVQSVSYGLYLGVCLAAAWIWRERLPAKLQPLIWGLAVMILAAMFFTKTRTVWLGAATVAILVLGVMLRGRARWLLLASVAAGVLMVGLFKADDFMAVKREGSVADTLKSADMRKAFAYVSLRMFEDKPIFGFGFGQFAREKLPYLNDRKTDLDLESIRIYVHHNTFLSILTETGAVGFALFLSVLLAWAYSAVWLVRSPQVPLYAQRHGLLMLATLGVAFWQMFGHEITFTPMEHSLIYLLAGITVGLKLQYSHVAATSSQLSAVGYQPERRQSERRRFARGV